MKRVVAVLEEHGTLDREEIAMHACVSINTLKGAKYLTILVAAGRIHIAKYRRNKCGPASPLYAAGPGENAKPPRPYTNSQKTQRWKKRTGYADKRRQAPVIAILNAALILPGIARRAESRLAG